MRTQSKLNTYLRTAARENSRMIFFHVFETDRSPLIGADVHGTMLPRPALAHSPYTYVISKAHRCQRENAKTYSITRTFCVVRRACNATRFTSTSRRRTASLSIYAVHSIYFHHLRCLWSDLNIHSRLLFLVFLFKKHTLNHRRARCTHFSISHIMKLCIFHIILYMRVCVVTGKAL